MEPNTVFEAITGFPAPRDEAAVAEPMNLENAGAACDFCPNEPATGIESPPVVWAFPAGQAEQSAELVPGSGIRIGLPFGAMLWKACERCRRLIKANKWADLARECGYPEGSNGSLSWEGFRVARLPGPGYAWPLVPHKLPTVHKHVRDAWKKGMLAFADHVRERLERSSWSSTGTCTCAAARMATTHGWSRTSARRSWHRSASTFRAAPSASPCSPPSRSPASGRWRTVRQDPLMAAFGLTLTEPQLGVPIAGKSGTEGLAVVESMMDGTDQPSRQPAGNPGRDSAGGGHGGAPRLDPGPAVCVGSHAALLTRQDHPVAALVHRYWHRR
ncbi:hypothetical protein [Streptomyces sp. NPDC059165]|uniref:hypothetical protein n=1 Tax=Streptomyces sp. NPDC059165 TaxID=3346751 RepID=UPI0036C04216